MGGPAYLAQTGPLPLTTDWLDVNGRVLPVNSPGLTGDAIASPGSIATTVVKINGISMAALATGILKNTTGTGQPSIAVPADFPILNQNTTGNAATATLAANSTAVGGITVTGTPSAGNVLTATSGTAATWQPPATSGTVTSVGLALPSIFTVTGSPVTSSGTLTATLATQNANLFFAGPSSGGAAAPTFRAIAVADVPTLNQNTTGSAATLTTARTISGVSFNGSANITIPFSGLSGSVAASQMPALTGDVTSSAGTVATTVVKINGVSMAGLATGILKNTTGTGAPSIAIAADFPTLNQNTTGNAATSTLASNSTAIGGITITGTPSVGWVPVATSGTTATWQALGGGSGTVTSVGLALPSIFTVSGSPVTASGTLTGALATQSANLFFAGPSSGAAAVPTFRAIVVADVPTLNQNTTGSAATLTTARTINGVAFDGSANITVAAAAGTLTGTTLNASVVSSSLTSVGILATGTWNATKIGLAYGGTNADLSATGGASQVLKQASSGAAVTVGQLGFSDLTGSVAATQMPALTGDVTMPAGSTATTLATAQAGNHTWSGTQSYANATYLNWLDSGGTARRIFGVNAANTTYVGPIDAGWGGDTYVRSAGIINFYVNGASGTFISPLTIAATGTSSFGYPVNFNADIVNAAGVSTRWIGTDTSGTTGFSVWQNLGFYTQSGATVTGTCKIVIPVAWTNTMQAYVIRGYDYSSVAAWEVQVSGYNATTPTWANTGATIIGNAPFTSVRLAYDGTNICILLGTTSTVWNYPKVFIDRLYVGHAASNTGWNGSYPITFITSEAGITNIASPSVFQTAPLANPTFTGTVTATTFSGAGTSLTGTATSLTAGDSQKLNGQSAAFYLAATATAADSSKLGGVAAASYAKLASPAFTGTPTAPTASVGTNTTQVATTAFVLANAGSSTAYTGNVQTTNPSNPTALTSTNTTAQMAGLAVAFTPSVSTRVLIVIQGWAVNTQPQVVSTTIRTGTGTAPTNGTNVTGTQRGGVNASNASTTRYFFSISAVVTGLTLSTAIWIDLACTAALAASSVSYTNLNVTVVEI